VAADIPPGGGSYEHYFEVGIPPSGGLGGHTGGSSEPLPLLGLLYACLPPSSTVFMSCHTTQMVRGGGLREV
jgi:hypothetical protein